MMKPVDWMAVRARFPVCSRMVYLNAAGGSPMCVDSAVEGKRYLDEMLLYGDTCWDDWLERTEQVRETLARFIGADAGEVAFVPNTSTGMAYLALMLTGCGGVLTTEDEFPSTTIPWLNRGYTVDYVPPTGGTYPADAFDSYRKPHHGILVSSYVQYRTGFRQQLQDIGNYCRKAGLIFGVNATQAMGVFPLDVTKYNIDFLVFSGLKWACAGYGTSGIFIRKSLLERFHLPVAGWRSVPVPEAMDNRAVHYKKEASALEAGSPMFSSIFALGGALNLFNALGREACTKRVLFLCRQLEKQLTEKGFPVIPVPSETHRSGIIMIKTDHAREIGHYLAGKNIFVSARGLGLRISVNIFNNEEDIDRLIVGLEGVKL